MRRLIGHSVSVIKTIQCLLLLFVLSNTTLLNAQQLLPTSYDTLEYNNTLVVNGFGFHQSSALKNDFTGRFLFGGEITEEIKDNSLENHGLFNKLGADVAAEMWYYFSPSFLKEKGVGMYVTGGQYFHFASEYANDFYPFAFYGNSRFENSGISLGNTRGTYMDYSKIGFGVFDKTTKNSIGLNFVVANDFYRSVIGRGALFNNTNENLIDYDIDFYYQNAASWANFQGAGVSLDFDYNMKIKDGGLFDGFVQIAGRNLGAVNIHRIEQWSMRNDGTYAGFTFSDIISALNEEGDIAILDSLGIEQRQNNAWVALPGYVQIGKIVDDLSENPFQLFFGARMYTTMAYFPMVYAGSHYTISPQFSLGAQATFGGFGNFRGGLYAMYHSNNLAIGAGTEDIVGVIPAIGFGRSAVIRMTYKW